MVKRELEKAAMKLQHHDENEEKSIALRLTFFSLWPLSMCKFTHWQVEVETELYSEEAAGRRLWRPGIGRRGRTGTLSR